MPKKKEEWNRAKFDAQTKRMEMIIVYLLQFFRVSIAGSIGFYFIYAVDSYLKNGPDQLSAAATIVKAFNLPTLIGLLTTGILGGALLRERRGKQRAIRKKGELQKRLEADDPNRSSSGLTEIGTTPERDE